jgi:hypothetical protein
VLGGKMATSAPAGWFAILDASVGDTTGKRMLRTTRNRGPPADWTREPPMKSIQYVSSVVSPLRTVGIQTSTDVESLVKLGGPRSFVTPRCAR